VTSPVDNFLTVVESALKGGLTLVQYRHKDDHDLVKLKEAYKLKQLCQNYGALLIINDRVDLAIAVNADGVHLGQTDFPVGLARQMLGHHRLIGKSTTNPQEMTKAIADGADYLGVGPVYETPTKAGKKAAGLEYVRYAHNHATVPWFAIGGISLNNLKDVLHSGAQRVAVVREIMSADNPTQVTRDLLAQL
jgi:thiamine-phosphate pyrophosphorylase